VDNPTFYTAVGLAIRYARQAQGLTQAALAERVGCQRITILRMEQGLDLRLHTVARVVAVLGVTVDSLLPLIGKPGYQGSGEVAVRGSER
jgi:transcriptional regulator with XRE-family HTH domain